MAIVTLTTDFGLKDGFVGIMKGVIWSICPEARLADISHEIQPQNILEAAWALQRAYSFFPPKTVHLAVVDPGVGTDRRAIAARLGEHYFVAPDNGLFTPILEAIEKQGGEIKFTHLTNPKYWLPQVSQTFHGRDVFAPVAAHLANGVPLEELGEAIHDPVRLSLPKPEKTSRGWTAHIVGIDHFGNLATDLPAAAVIGHEVIFHLVGREVRGLVQSYGEQPTGELVALINSAGFLEFAIVNGSAARALGASVGDLVEVDV
jgi:S-adenosylmethionine hydrolase